MKSKYLFLILCILTACQSSSLSPKALINWVEKKDNGLHREKCIDDWRIALQCEPAAYLRAKSGNQTQDSLLHVRLSLDMLNKGQKVMAKGIQNPQEYLERIAYFSYGMEQDIYLVSGKDTLQPALFHYERDYGLRPKHTFSMAFDVLDYNKDWTWVWYADMLTLGIVKITFKQNDLQAANQLQLTQ